jgi:ribosome-associated protein
MDVDAVVEHLLKRAVFGASRSSGPGGQHRDKASTRAELTLSLDGLDGLEPELGSLLALKLGLADRPLRISVQDERSLARNQELAIARLRLLVAEALAPPPPPRRRTRPSRAARAKRLAGKVRRGTTKRLRQPPAPE